VKSILFVVAHPDDVADGMGGTAFILKDKYRLHVLCATKGERGCPEWTLEKTVEVREKEERKACGLIDAKVHFLGKIDGEVFADGETCRQVAGFITELDPVALFTIWPVDNHPDHSAISEISRKAVCIAGRPIDIAYCEEGDAQTSHFTPDVYVNISDVIENKLEMIRCHQCQNRDDKMAQEFLRQTIRRGEESEFPHAEGFRIHSCGKTESTHVLKNMDKTKILAQQANTADREGTAADL
jgi:LmbE family N-acetylglucosaminyl deacetylase